VIIQVILQNNSPNADTPVCEGLLTFEDNGLVASELEKHGQHRPRDTCANDANSYGCHFAVESRFRR
jgi:hypothetical protein